MYEYSSAVHVPNVTSVLMYCMAASFHGISKHNTERNYALIKVPNMTAGNSILMKESVWRRQCCCVECLMQLSVKNLTEGIKKNLYK